MEKHKNNFSRKTFTRKFIERTLKGEKMGVGAYVWAAHRITGLIILGYFVLHLYTLSSILKGVRYFDQVMELMENPLIRVGEIVFLWIVAFHILNGIRLILLNIFIDLNEKMLAYSFSVAAVLIIIISIPFLS
jgi:succinate dehydrogenase / fumarate reductase cytochrome b subunit